MHDPSRPDFGPGWNVAPQTFQPIAWLNKNTDEREIVLMWWASPWFVVAAEPVGSVFFNGDPDQLAASSHAGLIAVPRRMEGPLNAHM
jgi:hypothetical protein